MHPNPARWLHGGTYVWYQTTTFPLSDPIGKGAYFGATNTIDKASNKRYYYPTAKSRLDLRTIKHPRGITA